MENALISYCEIYLTDPVLILHPLAYLLVEKIIRNHSFYLFFFIAFIVINLPLIPDPFILCLLPPTLCLHMTFLLLISLAYGIYRECTI